MCNKLSKYITSFRKCRRMQHSLLVMLEKWKKALDNGEIVCSIFEDILKAFDTINHDLLLAKPKAYGFSGKAFKLMCSYLRDRRKVVQTNIILVYIRKFKLVCRKNLLMVHFCLTYL